MKREGKIFKISRCAVDGLRRVSIAGTSFATDDGCNEVYIKVDSLTVAEVWNIKVGDKVTVEFNNE